MDELEAEYHLGAIFGEIKDDLTWYDGPLLAAETSKLEELRAALDVVIEYRRSDPERLLNQ